MFHKPELGTKNDRQRKIGKKKRKTGKYSGTASTLAYTGNSGHSKGNFNSEKLALSNKMKHVLETKLLIFENKAMSMFRFICSVRLLSCSVLVWLALQSHEVKPQMDVC